jgi:hypothetical protein
VRLLRRRLATLSDRDTKHPGQSQPRRYAVQTWVYGAQGQHNELNEINSLEEGGTSDHCIRFQGLLQDVSHQVADSLSPYHRNFDKRLADRLRGHDGTIGERLAHDLAAFQKPLPAPYDACEKRPGSVNSLSLVRYRNNDYSVPTAYGHQMLGTTTNKPRYDDSILGSAASTRQEDPKVRNRLL